MKAFERVDYQITKASNDLSLIQQSVYRTELAIVEAMREHRNTAVSVRESSEHTSIILCAVLGACLVLAIAGCALLGKMAESP